MIKNVNIRATAIQKFWGTEFKDSIYLWHGAKHNLILNDILNNPVNTIGDLFISEDEILTAYNYCKNNYPKFVESLTKALNNIHNLNLPSSFYETAFGDWFFRYVCVLYEKYSYLKMIDINNIDIKLLNKESFFTPYNHFDWFYCFTSDFGVQQLVSIYFYLFSKTEYQSKDLKFDINIEDDNLGVKSRRFNLRYFKSIIKSSLFLINSKRNNQKVKVALLGTYFANYVNEELLNKSNEAIKLISLPILKIKRKKENFSKRAILLSIKSENDFEYYLFNSLYYCMPKMFIEYFKEYYFTYRKSIQKQSFKYIVSEDWVGFINSSIYIAIAQTLNVKFICSEHGNTVLHEPNFLWTKIRASDIFLNIGWKNKNKKIIEGGFSSREISMYEFDPNKKIILFISFVSSIYLLDFSGNNAANLRYLKKLKFVDDFILLLPEKFKSKFVLRPRRENYLWDTEKTWNVENRNIKIDNGVFSESIQMARIIIIDHISSGLAELILNDIPFFIFIDPDIEMLNPKYSLVFEKLLISNILHYTQESVFNQLTQIYDGNGVELWWKSPLVRESIDYFRSEVLGNSLKTIDYLLSLTKLP